jgi:hypothetical protein
MGGDGAEDGELHRGQIVAGAFVEEQGHRDLLAAADQVAGHAVDVLEVGHDLILDRAGDGLKVC